MTRRSLLALMMAIILAGSVAAAWLLQGSAGRRINAGEAVIADIRGKGLSHFMDDVPRTDWYLLNLNDRPVGWKASAVWRTDTEAFAGVGCAASATGASKETWVLSNDARSGNYVAVSEGGSVTIRLGKGKVAAGRGAAKMVHRAEPVNYIPEGLMPLVIRQSALTRREAQFSVIFNRWVGATRHVQFNTIRMKPLGPTSDGRPKVRIIEFDGREKRKTDYEFDADGQLKAQTPGPEITLVKVTSGEVFRVFPSARMAMLSAMGKWKAELVRGSWGRPTTQPVATQPAD